MTQVTYLDNNATTRVAPEIIEAMEPFFTEFWGNPSSMHTFGGQVKAHVDLAREKVAALLGAQADEITFTSCGSESNNAALRGAVDFYGKPTHIITTAVEHPAVLSVCRYLKSLGHKVTELPVDGQGHIDLDKLDHALEMDGPSIASIMWANNETGVIFPIQDIAERVKAHGILFHSDAVQIAGKSPIDLSKTPIDLLSISGHKLHAPKGIGVLYKRRGTKINPFIIGGHQESGHRAGTENTAYIVGLGAACDLAMKHMDEEQSRVAAMRDRLEAGILASCPDTNVNGDPSCRLPNTTNIGFKYIEGEAILLMMDQYGICASSGSACTSGSLDPSHVMVAMDVHPSALHGSIRFSLSRYNTDSDVDTVLENLPGIVTTLRNLSPYTPK
ncbi:MAG: cysteine desulfurase NifS [Spartobacteria bacterium]|nr:cysteine desulfurase NifS [Spartobacteria bacterium]